MEKGISRKIDIHNPELSWTKIIAKNLGISEREAQARIDRNNALPIEEKIGERVILTRFDVNASLLASASPNFMGPRGPRPSLVSAERVFNLSNFTSWQKDKYFKRFKEEFGGMRNILLNLGLTASNPRFAPKGIEFSDDDMRYGIYIPEEIDIPTAQAIGLTYGNGTFGNGANLVLASTLKNEEFYRNTVRSVFENAFNFLPDQEIKYAENKNPAYTEKEIMRLRLHYGSKAVRTYFENYINFPLNKDQRKNSGISDKVKNMDRKLQDEFLKYFLALTLAFDQNDGFMRISDKSRPLLEDIGNMVKERVTKKSINLTHNGTSSFVLSIGTTPTMELYILGYLDINPGIKKRAELRYLNGKIPIKSLTHLRKTYRDLAPTSIRKEQK